MPAWFRRAIDAADDVCEWPGSGRPAPRLESFPSEDLPACCRDQMLPLRSLIWDFLEILLVEDLPVELW